MPSPTLPPTLTAAPTSPDRADRATFSARSIALDDWRKNSNVPEMTLALANVYSNALGAYNDATAAAGAAAAAGATIWVTGTVYAIGDARYSPIDFQTYRRRTNGAGATDPSLDSTNWARVNLTPPSVVRSPRIANAVLVEADRHTLVDVTAGTFAQTFTPAGGLGDGWSTFYRNSGTGFVTLTPFAGDLIDGLASFVMYPNEARLIISDGTNFHSIVLHPFTLEPTVTMNFIEPPGYRGYDTFLQAPGGGGGSGRQGAAGSTRGGGGGGGAGGTAWAVVLANTPGASITLTVGADGVGGTAVATVDTVGNNGTAGGSHSFGTLLSAPGGAAGVGAGAGAGGAASAGSGTPGAQVAFAGTAGGAAGQPAGAGTAAATWAATGGGGGGNITAGNVVSDGAAGGASGTATTATQLAGGAAGTSAGTRNGGAGNSASVLRGGTGGGGGASHLTQAGGTGGAGVRGGGGGGGSGSTNGAASGAGGNSTGYHCVKGVL